MSDQLRNKSNADAELAEQRAWFETALASIADAVIITDVEGMVTYMCHTAQQLTGWSQKESLKKPVREIFNIVNESTRKPIEDLTSTGIRDGPIIDPVERMILLSRDGNEWPIDHSAGPIRDSTGKIIGVVLIFRNIINRRLAEKRLEISEIRYRRLFEAAHDGILILDAESGKVVDVNPF